MIEKIVDAAIRNNAIEKDDREILIIAYENLIFSVITWGTFIIICFLSWYFFSTSLQNIIFLLFYIPIRIYAGGLHQATRLKCYIQSLFIFFLFIGCNELLINKSIYILFILAVLSIFIIIIFSPVEDMNKKLSTSEKICFRKNTYIILFIECFMLVVLYILGCSVLFNIEVLSLITIAVQLILGKYKNAKILSMTF